MTDIDPDDPLSPVMVTADYEWRVVAQHPEAPDPMVWDHLSEVDARGMAGEIEGCRVEIQRSPRHWQTVETIEPLAIPQEDVMRLRRRYGTVWNHDHYRLTVDHDLGRTVSYLYVREGKGVVVNHTMEVDNEVHVDIGPKGEVVGVEAIGRVVAEGDLVRVLQRCQWGQH